jgi:hypothetical protein
MNRLANNMASLFLWREKMIDFVIAIIDVVLSLFVGLWARNKYRSGVWWFFLSIMFSPLIMGALLILMGDASPNKYRKKW